MIDRLSRIQEKLSGFDYIDTGKMQELLTEDTDALWHQQQIQRGKDFWTAIKVTVGDIFNKVLDRPQEDKGIKEEFLSFEDSEEMRSRDFFKDQTNHQAKKAPTAKEEPKASKSISHDQFSRETKESQEKARLLKLKSIDLKRQQFEKERLPLNQEYCSGFGFSYPNKRLPEINEISWTYWQAERLTAIEGRLYGEKLEAGKKKIDENKLILQAREELSKNQAAPKYIMDSGRASKLTEARLKQFEQHVLIYQDKTGRAPEPVDLDHIRKAIKIHDQFIVQEIKQTINSPKMAKNPDIYRTLIEQQAVLAYLIKGSTRVQDETLNKATLSQSQATTEQDPAQMTKNVPNGEANTSHPSASKQDMSKATNNREMRLRTDNEERHETSKKDEKISSTSFDSFSLKVDDIRDSCSDRFQKLNNKVQELKDFNQRMADLDLRRQNDKGMGMDM